MFVLRTIITGWLPHGQSLAPRLSGPRSFEATCSVGSPLLLMRNEGVTPSYPHDLIPHVNQGRDEGVNQGRNEGVMPWMLALAERTPVAANGAPQHISCAEDERAKTCPAEVSHRLIHRK